MIGFDCSGQHYHHPDVKMQGHEAAVKGIVTLVSLIGALANQYINIRIEISPNL